MHYFTAIQFGGTLLQSTHTKKKKKNKKKQTLGNLIHIKKGLCLVVFWSCRNYDGGVQLGFVMFLFLVKIYGLLLINN